MYSCIRKRLQKFSTQICTDSQIKYLFCKFADYQLARNLTQQNTQTHTPQDLLELPSPQWVTKHPLVQCQITTDPTPITHYQPDQQTIGGSGVAVGPAGVPVAYYGLFAIFATQKTTFLWICYRGISTSSQ